MERRFIPSLLMFISAWNKSGGQATLLFNLRDAVALARGAETHCEKID
jgi:hypothetical protein